MLVGAVLLYGACAAHTGPYSAEEAARDSARDPGAALVRYLAQPGADAAVCDLSRDDGPRLARLDDGFFEDLVDGLVDGDVPVATWQACTAHLLAQVPSERGPAFAHALATAYGDALDGADDGDNKGLPILFALHQAFTRRPPQASLAAVSATALVAELDAWLGDADRRPEVRAIATDALMQVELERGDYRGAPVDAARLASIADEGVLGAMQRRLPAADLRAAALRRFAHLRVTRSDDPDVRTHAAAAEEALVAHGRFPVPLGGDAGVERCTFDAGGQTSPWVSVRQDVMAHRATLRPFGGELPRAIPLQGWVRLDVRGFARPLAVCPAAPSWDPTPCVAPGELLSATPYATVGADGALRVDALLSSEQLVELLQVGATLAVPFAITGGPECTAALPLRLVDPPPLEFAGGTGETGPTVAVDARELPGSVLALDVRAGAARYVVAIDTAQPDGSFAVVTRGGQGSSGYGGRRGSDGATGMAGMAASCPYSNGGTGDRGGDGGRGGDGSPGGAGGDGGRVNVTLHCAPESCADARAWLEVVVRSEGGAGGPGGAGGAGGSGGAGGAGGSSASCSVPQYTYGQGTTYQTKYVSGGMAGSRGMDGPSGSAGSRGLDGSAGDVRFTVIEDGS